MAADLRKSKDFFLKLYDKVPAGGVYNLQKMTFEKKPGNILPKVNLPKDAQDKLTEEVFYENATLDKTLEEMKLTPDQIAQFDRSSEAIALIMLLFDDSVQPGTVTDAFIEFTVDSFKFSVTAPYKFFTAFISNFFKFIFSPITTMLPEKPKQTFDTTCNYYFSPDESTREKYGIGADDDYHYGREE